MSGLLVRIDLNCAKNDVNHSHLELYFLKKAHLCIYVWLICCLIREKMKHNYAVKDSFKGPRWEHLDFIWFAFCCRRRLATVLVYLKFAEHLREAVTYIEQGHVRVGPDVVTDPAFLVTRNMEDFVTWVDSSKIKRKVMEYNERLDDYDALNA